MELLILLIIPLLLIWIQRLVYSRYWIRQLSIDLLFSRNLATEGETIDLSEILTSRKALPLPWLTVKFQVSRNLVFPDKINATVTDYYYREDLFSIGLYQRISRKLSVYLKKRGYYTIKSIDLISSDLLLSSKLVAHVNSHSFLTVCPQLLDNEDIAIPFQQLMGMVLALRSIVTDPFEFKGIREYQSYDNLRSINWLATARTGAYKVNTHDSTATRLVRVLLNVEPDKAFYEETLLEEAIRLAATLCHDLILSGVTCSLETNGRDIMTGQTINLPPAQSASHIQQIQESLGRLDLLAKPASFADMLEILQEQQGQDEVLCIISLNCSPDIIAHWDLRMLSERPAIWLIPVYRHDSVHLPEVRQGAEHVLIREVNRNVI